ncbi:carboxypeptidase-like regulatory domain-containing protein [Pedobacter lusitanus]|nr:carboxypeptidase-like regulatory domain-containing protein [Pedobacter lusitanus]
MITFMQVSAAGYAQRITLKENRMPLEKVFKIIHHQTGYDFLYDRKLISAKEPLNIDVRAKTVEEVLDLYLADLLLDYTVSGKTVVLKEKKKSFFERVSDALSAEDISGKVLDETGLPLPGATIKVKKQAELLKQMRQAGFQLIIWMKMLFYWSLLWDTKPKKFV